MNNKYWFSENGTIGYGELSTGEVFCFDSEDYRNIIGTSSKPKSRNQIVKWLRDPHSDSAEYKMWGNGVALPCVVFVLSGIVYYSRQQP